MSRNYLPANPPRTLPDLWLYDDVSSPSSVAWPAPLARYVHGLHPTERATVRIVPPRVEDVPLGLGRISDGMLRLALMGQRRALPWASAGYVARQLQAGMYSIHPLALRSSKRGWEALASLAVYGFIEATIAATPTETDPHHFRPMPLADRISELALSTCNQNRTDITS